MKTLKKLLGLVTAALMVLTLVLPASAADPTYTLTINNTDPNHTYQVYQLFTGRVDEKSGKLVLSDIQWGNGLTNISAFLDELKADSTIGNLFTGKTEARDIAKVLEGFSDNSTQLKIFSGVARSHLTNPTNVTYSGSYSTQVPGGYYLIKDKDDSTGIDYFTGMILKVVGNAEAEPKGEVPDFEKKVMDINDTIGGTGTWGKTADHDIGDSVQFQLTATLPSNLSSYNNNNDPKQVHKYILNFHDTLSAGLAFQNDAVVKVGNTTVTTGYTVVTSGLTDGCNLEIQIPDIFKLGTVPNAGDTITVEYSAKLTADAVIGNPGNPNTAHIQYSNNPNNTDLTGDSAPSQVKVFTYLVKIDKVDESKQSLPGAAFKLEKKVNGVWTLLKDYADEAGTMTSFEFKGLDDGDYRLTESKTPAGYNTADVIEFTIAADHDDPSLTLKELTDTSTTTDALFLTEMDDDGVLTGQLTTRVINVAGTLLPSTGGAGTTMLFGLGLSLMAVSGVLLVARKRTSYRA